MPRLLLLLRRDAFAAGDGACPISTSLRRRRAAVVRRHSRRPGWIAGETSSLLWPRPQPWSNGRGPRFHMRRLRRIVLLDLLRHLSAEHVAGEEVLAIGGHHHDLDLVAQALGDD